LNGFEGGYVTTNEPSLFKQLALMRGFGFQGADSITVTGGMNAKLNEVHAAMALASLDGIDEQVALNRRRYFAYKRFLAGIPWLRLLEFDESHRTAYKNVVVELLDEWPLTRSDTIKILNEENILARAYYSPPLHQKTMAYDYIAADLPLTDYLSCRYLNLPCGQLVSNDDITDIVELLSFISKHADLISDHFQQNGVA
jgi:dTDP-4-amino-4,6-dideoxygalactose transaminase